MTPGWRSATQASAGRHPRAVTRYGFAIKALPRPDDEDEDDLEEGIEGDTEAPDDDLEDDELMAADDNPADQDAKADDEPAAEPQEPTDDARPWAGDMYDEGDESDPAAAYSAFTGQNGEQAWLDKAPDGTLTGWVRDPAGQVWRYSDADAWAVDVDDAGMTRSHGGEEEPPPADPVDNGAQQDQLSMGPGGGA